MQIIRQQYYQEELARMEQFDRQQKQKQMSRKKFDINKIGQIDDLLMKNEQIYKNLKKKLEGITEAERNIANNIKVIKPISYASKQREKQGQSILNSSAINNPYYPNISKDPYQRSILVQDFSSSPIQTQRRINQSFKRHLLGLSHHNGTSLQQQILNESKTRSRLHNPIPQNSYYPYGDSFMKRSNTYNHEGTFVNLRDSASGYLLSRDKENSYMTKSAFEISVDSIVRMNFSQLAQRRNEIEKIYQELKKEEEEIQDAYQKYKQGITKMSELTVSKDQQKSIQSPPKNSQSKKQLNKSQPIVEDTNPSKLSTIQKNQSQANIRQSSLNNTTRTIYMNQTGQNISKPPLSPNKHSFVRYCTQQFSNLEIPQRKPLALSAKCHIYIPFNKLFKSPIIQMKNHNTLILARQSKLAQQKTNEQKIVDGKKYQFKGMIETDQQQIVKGVLKDQHSIIAIVGGHGTLKKKLHMTLIAHAFDTLLKVIYSQQYNCLSLNLSYEEIIEKSETIPTKISNTVQINQQSPPKISILQIQKTIEQIYEAIKRPPAEQSLKTSAQAKESSKNFVKIVRFTKINLLFGKQLVWSCHVMSANQVSFQFLKQLQVKNIIWSINPLIKNYQQVAKTLNQATRYQQARIPV